MFFTVSYITFSSKRTNVYDCACPFQLSARVFICGQYIFTFSFIRGYVHLTVLPTVSCWLFNRDKRVTGVNGKSGKIL